MKRLTKTQAAKLLKEAKAEHKAAGVPLPFDHLYIRTNLRGLMEAYKLCHPTFAAVRHWGWWKHKK